MLPEVPAITTAPTPPDGPDAAAAAFAETYSTRSAADIINMELPPLKMVWGGLSMTQGEILELIGGSGIGKSRLVLNLAVSQILGRPFAGYDVHPEPLAWLLVGTENSIYRLQHDLRAMSKILRNDQIDLLGRHLHLTTLERSEDAYLCLADEANVEKLKATIRKSLPDVLVVDPWGDFVAGDELREADVRDTVRLLRDCAKVGRPNMPIVILNHARMGAKEDANACGANAGNFGKNLKTLYTIARSVWNIRRGDMETPPQKVEMIHAKCSNGKCLPPVALELNANTMFYAVDDAFDHDAWQAELEAAAKQGGANAAKTKAAKVTSDYETLTDAAYKALDAAPDRVIGTAILKLRIREATGIGTGRTDKLVAALKQDQKLAQVHDGYGGQFVIGRPDDVRRYLDRKNALPGLETNDRP